MKADIFKNFDPWAKQKDIAVFFLARLKSAPVAEHPCHDYASAKALAHMITRFDKENLCQSVHVFGNFVRLYRNEKGSFAFPAVVLDHYDNRLQISGGCNRP